MVTVTIPRKEYNDLLDAKLRYEYVKQILDADIFLPPPTRSVRRIILEFKKTKLYNRQFLGSVGRGLKRSSLPF